MNLRHIYDQCSIHSKRSTSKSYCKFCCCKCQGRGFSPLPSASPEAEKDRSRGVWRSRREASPSSRQSRRVSPDPVQTTWLSSFDFKLELIDSPEQSLSSGSEEKYTGICPLLGGCVPSGHDSPGVSAGPFEVLRNELPPSMTGSKNPCKWNVSSIREGALLLELVSVQVSPESRHV